MTDWRWFRPLIDSLRCAGLGWLRRIALMKIQTKRLELVLLTREAVLERVARLTTAERSQISPDWLEQVKATDDENVWVHGFEAYAIGTKSLVAQCGFKGPPQGDGVVELAYGVEPEHQGNGFATEVAEALSQFALGCDNVSTVRAHTLPESNASTRVLTKCGFRKTGEVIDPEDGLVWRWELP